MQISARPAVDLTQIGTGNMLPVDKYDDRTTDSEYKSVLPVKLIDTVLKLRMNAIIIGKIVWYQNMAN